MLGATRQGLRQCPDVTIALALQRAAAKFFAATLVWEDDLNPIPLVLDQDQYEIDTDDGVRVVRIIGATLDDQHKTQVTVSRWRDLTAMHDSSKAPRYVALHTAIDAIKVWPRPDAAATQNKLLLRVALSSTRDATDVPDRLVDDWQTAFISAAKAELQATPNTPWYDPKESLRQQSIYNELEASAKRIQLSGNGAEIRVRYRPFV